MFLIAPSNHWPRVLENTMTLSPTPHPRRILSSTITPFAAATDDCCEVAPGRGRMLSTSATATSFFSMPRLNLASTHLRPPSSKQRCITACIHFFFEKEYTSTWSPRFQFCRMCICSAISFCWLFWSPENSSSPAAEELEEVESSEVSSLVSSEKRVAVVYPPPGEFPLPTADPSARVALWPILKCLGSVLEPSPPPWTPPASSEFDLDWKLRIVTRSPFPSDTAGNRGCWSSIALGSCCASPRLTLFLEQKAFPVLRSTSIPTTSPSLKKSPYGARRPA
mmetsp:Transcript_34542/g.83557  ORF Transcript_34542/g.83557 Transcript_34542/m.83557 type:complete len:280 (+) Transcript_34542:2827-3666(+)